MVLAGEVLGESGVSLPLCNTQSNREAPGIEAISLR